MAVLSAYRTDVHNLLATAVDPSKWPLEIIDQALRLALDDLNPLLAYETDFTVISTSYTQDLSTVTDILNILALAYPWVDGSEFSKLMVAWRRTGLQSVYITEAQPTIAQKIRVRYTKAHAIQSLDSASTTTVPSKLEKWIGYDAAGWACTLRQRQVSEDPALAVNVVEGLGELAAMWRGQFQTLAATLPPLGNDRYAQEGQ